MFSFLKKATFLLLVALFIGTGTGLFTACDTNADDDGTIYGTWVSQYGEEYKITSSTLTVTDTFAGTIENIHKDGPGAGYITIKFTEHSTQYKKNGSPLNPVGRFYVIHYKNLTSSTVQLSQAYNANDPDGIESEWGNAGGSAGKQNIKDAEIYTVGNSYFTVYSACQKQP
jgi:hypothetical protein